MKVYLKMIRKQHLLRIFDEDEQNSWNKPGRQVFNQIRGLSPWPVAYTTMDDTNLKFTMLSSLRLIR